MTQQKGNAGNAEQKQKLKKYLVFMVMFLGFGGCMWWIFAPAGSDTKAAGQEAGFNADIPDPKGAGMVSDKKTAYEQEQARLKQEEKMRSLQDYSFMLGATDERSGDDMGTGTTQADDPEQLNYSYSGSSYGSPGSYTGYSGRRSNAFESSNSAYRDINRTLGSFYEDAQEDSHKEELREEIESLRAMVAEQQKVAVSYDDQIALLEKSYQLAAKYMPPAGGSSNPTDGNQAGENNKSGKKIRVTAVSHVEEPVVSSLNPPMSDMEFVKQFSGERNTGFNTATGEEAAGDRNTIGAVVHQDQTLVNGQSVKLRMTEPVRAGGYVIPRNTILTGVGKIAGERLEIQISSIEYEGNIIPVDIQAYDSDGQQGIYIPGSMEMTAIKEIAGNMGQSLGSSINISRQGAGDQLLTDLGRGVIQGTSQYVSKKVREIKVSLKAGYRILLLPSDNN